MTRFLLDTSVISNATRSTPSEKLLDWLAAQRDQDLFIPTLAVAEIRRGILQKEAGRKRRELEAWFSGPQGPQALFAGRVLPFDETAALAWAELMAQGAASAQPRNVLDVVVAAIARANDCKIVTDNEKHFRGLDIVNPMRSGAAVAD